MVRDRRPKYGVSHEMSLHSHFSGYYRRTILQTVEVAGAFVLWWRHWYHGNGHWFNACWCSWCCVFYRLISHYYQHLPRPDGHRPAASHTKPTWKSRASPDVVTAMMAMFKSAAAAAAAAAGAVVAQQNAFVVHSRRNHRHVVFVACFGPVDPTEKSRIRIHSPFSRTVFRWPPRPIDTAGF